MREGQPIVKDYFRIGFRSAASLTTSTTGKGTTSSRAAQAQTENSALAAGDKPGPDETFPSRKMSRSPYRIRRLGLLPSQSRPQNLPVKPPIIFLSPSFPALYKSRGTPIPNREC
jgi:hypothetical protein